MSHYARIVQPLAAQAEVISSKSGAPLRVVVTVPLDAEVKCVHLDNTGTYRFQAKIDGQWRDLLTEADLPAFTDKGRAHRADHPVGAATLEQGRPPLYETPFVASLGVRMTRKQKKWVKERAKANGLNASEYVRHVLLCAGMPE